MKILQLVTKRQYRGAEVFAANLSQELINLGHEIIFVGLYRNDKDILWVEGAENRDLILAKDGGFSLKLVKELRDLIKELNPEIVQCNGSDTLKYMIAASFVTTRIPVIYRNISTISEWIDSAIKLTIYKAIFRRVDHVTSVGSESIRDLISTLNYPESQTSVIRRGIPLKTVNNNPTFDLRKELGLQASDQVVMHIGNFSPEKNHEFLLDIFSEIKDSHPNIKLILVGTGITFNIINSKIQDLNLGDTIFSLGFRKDIPELLSQANCFALCSKIEGVPGVILEAASQKIPSISTDVGGVNEVLINNETGFIIKNFDKIEYRQKLILLVENKVLNSEMGEKAYRLVIEEFNPVKNARKFEGLYSALLKNDSEVYPNQKGKLRILQLIQKKQFRGAEVFASQLSTHLLNSGHSVEIVSIYSGNAQLPFPEVIRTLDRRKSNRGLDLRGWKKLAELVKELNPDIIQANASDTLKYAVLSKIFFRWKTPIIYRNASTSSFYINNQLSKATNAFLLSYVNLIVSVSRASLDDLISLFPFVKSKGIVLPVGVEEKFLLENYKKINRSSKNILHIGSFTREKNHEGLLRIFNSLLQNNIDVNLHLVGSGPLLETFKEQVRKLKLEKRVKIFSEKEDTREFFLNADVFVLPSLVEGLPGVLLEAMACRIPVIAYNVGGISEIVTYSTGFLVTPGDEDQFAQNIIDSMRDSELIVDNAYLEVKTKYLNKKLVSKFESEYYHLLNKRLKPKD